MRKFLFVSASALLATLALIFVTSLATQAASPVLVRGIVKHSDNPNIMNLYITHVTTAPDASAIRGRTLEVNTSHTQRYAWQVVGKALKKVRVTSNPAPGKEVVVRGTLTDTDRITAAAITQNYRLFRIEGTVQGVTLDTGSTDTGWITVTVTSAKLRNVTPAIGFKEAILKNTDLKIRVDGLTTVAAKGNSKNLDEVSASQQRVRVEGELQNESTWTAASVNEL